MSKHILTDEERAELFNRHSCSYDETCDRYAYNAIPEENVDVFVDDIEDAVVEKLKEKFDQLSINTTAAEKARITRALFEEGK